MAVFVARDGLMQEKSVSVAIGYLPGEIFFSITIWLGVSTMVRSGRARRKRISDAGSVEEKTPLI